MCLKKRFVMISQCLYPSTGVENIKCYSSTFHNFPPFCPSFNPNSVNKSQKAAHQPQRTKNLPALFPHSESCHPICTLALSNFVVIMAYCVASGDPRLHKKNRFEQYQHQRAAAELACRASHAEHRSGKLRKITQQLL